MVIQSKFQNLDKKKLMNELTHRRSGLEAELQKLELEADSLEELREQIRASTPFGFEVHSEEVIADGKPKTITARGKTLEEAFSKCRTQVPTGAQIVRETALQTPGQRTITVKAFDEKEASEEARRMAKPGEIVQDCLVVEPGKRGFLGLGRKPALYETALFQNAIVEIIAKGNASVRITVGKKELVEYIRQLSREISGLLEAQAQFRSGAPESRAASSPVSSSRY